MPERTTNHNLLPAPLPVPDVLRPSDDRQLPDISMDTFRELKLNGWNKAGIMVALVDTDGAILSQAHRSRAKNLEGALGPLGETLKPAGDCRLETPTEAFRRGLLEEWGVADSSEFEFYTFEAGGWTINQWPAGLAYPGVFNCAIAFPLFVPDSTKERIQELWKPTYEVSAINFIQPDEIMAMDAGDLRPGVKQWLAQMQQNDLLDPTLRPLARFDQAPVEVQV